ncbi:MAG: alpha-L-fucosidase [Planctomycetota bacterium]|nr:alpha-L-fucosidase [Planctomycetota bacterium]
MKAMTMTRDSWQLALIVALVALPFSDAWAADLTKADPAAIARWQDMRFGMFIHWGPVSITAKEISHSRGSTELPIEKYDALYKEFNPVKFNADEWAATARAAGMKYMVLTAKHHDGFCLWDTKCTDYNIMRSPFSRDVTKELSAACHRAGLAFGVYYSVCDWHHPDFPRTGEKGKVVRETSDLDRYTVYLKAQITELLQGYGPILTLWFDHAQVFGGDRGQVVINLARSLQPDILVNNRSMARGDFDTPQQKVGIFNLERPWESCMTITTSGGWSWRGEKDGAKPLADCLAMLVRCAGADGNMLLNVGPRPDGLIDPKQVSRLAEIGDWLAKYGDAIYGTRGGPYLPTQNIASTRKGNTIYLHITAWPEDTCKLPALAAKIRKSSLLTGGAVNVRQTADGLEIAVPKSDRQAMDTIVVLELDMPAIQIGPITVKDERISPK